MYRIIFSSVRSNLGRRSINSCGSWVYPRFSSGCQKPGNTSSSSLFSIYAILIMLTTKRAHYGCDLELQDILSCAFRALCHFFCFLLAGQLIIQCLASSISSLLLRIKSCVIWHLIVIVDRCRWTPENLISLPLDEKHFVLHICYLLLICCSLFYKVTYG